MFDYVFTHSKNSENFVALLDSGIEIDVYGKLPKAFLIPSPVGGYTPNWAIALKHGAVKHLYFVAETKGSMRSMEFRKIEATKIEFAQKFIAKIYSDQCQADGACAVEKEINAAAECEGAKHACLADSCKAGGPVGDLTGLVHVDVVNVTFLIEGRTAQFM